MRQERQNDEMSNFIYLLTGGLFNGGDFYSNAVQHGNDVAHRAAQAQTGDSPTIINRAINRYLASLPAARTSANLPVGPTRAEFQEELDNTSATAYIAIAYETILEIITTTPPPGMFSTPNYPSIIPEQHKAAFATLHRNFSCLSQPLKDQVRQTIHVQGGPENVHAKAVWNSIRGYADHLTHGNRICSAAIQQALQQRAQH
jgi:hypothetical protein